MKTKLRSWTDFYKMWLEDHDRIHILVVFYEDLKLELTLQKMVEFLSFEVDKDRIKCVTQNLNGLVHRKAKPELNLKTVFSKGQKTMILQHVQSMEENFKNAGQGKLPGSYYDLSKY